MSLSAQVGLTEAASEDEDSYHAIELRERTWVPGLMVLMDIIAIETALLLGYLARNALSLWWPIELAPSVYAGLIIGVLVLPLAYYLVGLHPGYGLGGVERLRRRLSVTVFVFMILIAWDNIVQTGAWSRGIMVATFGFALVLTPLCETLARAYLIRKRFWGLPVLLIGTEETGARLTRVLKAEPQLGFLPVGLLTADVGPRAVEVAGIPVLGLISEAEKYKDQVNTVILAMGEVGAGRLVRLFQDLPFHRIIVIPDFFALPSLWVTPRDLGGVLALEMRQNLLIRRNRIIKRVLDYVLGIPLFLVSLPILAIAALCIKTVSSGSAFYTQERIGMYGHRFRMIKLRTMRPDADRCLEEHLSQDPKAREEWARFVKLRDDPRLVPYFGAFFRKISLDEVPQLWNILRGEMSLAGPRPFTDEDLPHYGADFLNQRQLVRPGISGLWQVLARSNGDARSKELLDTYYIRNWSLWLDLYVLVRTPWSVLSMKGAY